MTDRLPSLELLLQVIAGERDKQQAHFEALDSKAGVVLGFAGLLVTLAPNVNALFLIPALLAAAAAAGLSLSSFWPRSYPTLEPAPLRRYVAAQERFTRLTLLDTMEVMVNQTSQLLRRKGRRLRLAMIALAIAAVLFAAGILESALRGDRHGGAGKPSAAATTYEAASRTSPAT